MIIIENLSILTLNPAVWGDYHVITIDKCLVLSQSYMALTINFQNLMLDLKQEGELCTFLYSYVILGRCFALNMTSACQGDVLLWTLQSHSREMFCSENDNNVLSHHRWEGLELVFGIWTFITLCLEDSFEGHFTGMDRDSSKDKVIRVLVWRAMF